MNGPSVPRRFVPMLPVLVLLLHAGPARGQTVVPTGFIDEGVVAGLARPVGMAFVPGGPRVFVIEQVTGRVRLVVNGTLAANDPVLTVDSVRTTNGEQGLLGIAVDPRWPAHPYLYVLYDALSSPNLRIRRYTVGGDLAWTVDGALTVDPASRFEVLTTLPDDTGVHNGGTLRFGPDGMLYASMGEDNAPCEAQRVDTFHGKLLRMDVSTLPAGPGGPPALATITPADNPFVGNPEPRARLVWQYGLRNPFRFHIDPLNGEAMIADVGQERYEEIDWAPAAGLNFGWPQREANSPSPVTWCGPFDSTSFVAPVYVFDHLDPPGGGGSASIVSGGIYRRPIGGAGFPAEYEGRYVFTDYYRGYVRMLERSGGTWVPVAPVPGQPNPTDWGDAYGFITDMLVGPDGALYYCQQITGSFSQPTGQIRRIRHGGIVGTPGQAHRDVTLQVSSPARAGLVIRYGLPEAAPVTLDLYDVEGRRITRLVQNRHHPLGLHQVVWDGRDDDGRSVTSGVVFARLVAGTVTRSTRFTLLR